MKKIVCTIACIMTSCIILAACQKTPEDIVVVNKNNANLVKKIESQEDIVKEIIFPDKLDLGEIYDDGYLKVQVKADIITPTVDKYPVVSIKPMDITQDIADDIMNVLIGDKTLYLMSEKRTKKEIENEISDTYKYIKEDLAEYEKSDPDFYKRKKQDLIDWIKYLYEQLESSPDELLVHDKKFKPLEDGLQDREEKSIIEHYEKSGLSDEEIEEKLEMFRSQRSKERYIKGYVDIDNDNKASLVIEKITDKSKFIVFGLINKKVYMNGYNPIVDDGEVSISQDNALSIAKNLLAKLGLDNVVLDNCNTTKIYDKNIPADEYAYNFNFVRQINSVPVNYVDGNANLKIETPLTIFREHWQDEKIVVCVDKSGVIGFSWRYPVSVLEIINDNVELLPFDKVTEIFKKQIVIQNVYKDESIEKRVITVDNARLGLMKVAKKNSDTYMYIPVWDFYGYDDVKYKSEQNKIRKHDDDTKKSQFSLLTINAIDGSIINRQLGY